MKAYKVVIEGINGKYYSAIMFGCNDFRKEYKIGKWVYAKRKYLEWGLGLFAFKDYDAAKYFRYKYILNFPDVKIFECEIGQILPLPEFSIHWFDPGEYKSILRLLKKHGRVFIEECLKFGSPKSNWPIGTICTDKIKLIKEIKDENRDFCQTEEIEE